MWAGGKGKNGNSLSSVKTPPVSFFSLKHKLNSGEILDFETLKGKKVLIVNTASDCGYTDQYADLQKLSDKFAGKLIILAFPANDFKEQEKGSDEEIASFCKLNYGITFPLMKKSSVIKSQWQNPVYQWLTDEQKNGWNAQPPSWNFSKYLVSENGTLLNYFGPAVSPLSKEISEAIG
jgi:glutathione peroxidase